MRGSGKSDPGDTGPDGDDESYEIHGVRVVVDRASLPYLTGADVDYIDGLTGAGFQISNPNVVAACGCGSSFQATDEVEAAEVPEADCGPGCGCG